MVYAYAVDELDFRRSHFDVRKANKSVWRFHERFGAERVAETEKDFLYQISLEAIRKAMSRYRKYLPLPLAIE
jgi:RimJ/RimL family protein N-acetyltransferase